jgi:hypothetical protein
MQLLHVGPTRLAKRRDGSLRGTQLYGFARVDWVVYRVQSDSVFDGWHWKLIVKFANKPGEATGREVSFGSAKPSDTREYALAGARRTFSTWLSSQEGWASADARAEVVALAKLANYAEHRRKLAVRTERETRQRLRASQWREWL